MPPPFRCTSLILSPSICAKQCYRTSQSRSFFSTPRHDQRVTRNRRQLFRWLNQIGVNFENPASGSTNYLGAYNPEGKLRRSSGNEKDKDGNEGRKSLRNNRESEPKEVEGEEKKKVIPPETARDLRPFPHNQMFRSQPVLSEELREKIWEKIMLEGWSVRDTSAKLGVEMSRVGAVVRLMEIEKEWKRIGKPLARPYAQAVLSMLPKTAYVDPEDKGFRPHESINDLPLHASTGQQIFHPTSESRVFTRADAAKAFSDTLLPADDRVPHPELALMHKDFLAKMTPEEIQARQEERDAEVEKNRKKFQEREGKRSKMLKVVDRPRWEFRIMPIKVDDAGKDGRGHKGVGWRYGAPLMDRSRAQVKIPTKAGL